MSLAHIRASPKREYALSPCFIGFASREPVSASRANAPGGKASKQSRQYKKPSVGMRGRRGEGTSSASRAGHARHGASADSARCFPPAMAEPRLRPAVELALNTRAARQSVLAALVIQCSRPARDHCQLTQGRIRVSGRRPRTEIELSIAWVGSSIALGRGFRCAVQPPGAETAPSCEQAARPPNGRMAKGLRASLRVRAAWPACRRVRRPAPGFRAPPSRCLARHRYPAPSAYNS